MKKIVFLSSLLGLIFIAGCSRVEETKNNVPHNTGLLVINILDKPFYEDAHIKGSIHVPFMDLADFAQNLDRKTEVVVYCSNYACSASGAAAKQLRDMGFSHVWAYEGGMAEWYQLQLPVEGPAGKDYLRADNEKMESDESVAIISSQDLKKKMEEHALL